MARHFRSRLVAMTRQPGVQRRRWAASQRCCELRLQASSSSTKRCARKRKMPLFQKKSAEAVSPWAISSSGFLDEARHPKAAARPGNGSPRSCSHTRLGPARLDAEHHQRTGAAANCPSSLLRQKARFLGMSWSAGSTSMSASGSSLTSPVPRSRRGRGVAAEGLDVMLRGSQPAARNWSATRKRWSWLRRRSAARARWAAPASVAASLRRDSCHSRSGRNCFGYDSRDIGQSRVPDAARQDHRVKVDTDAFVRRVEHFPSASVRVFVEERTKMVFSTIMQVEPQRPVAQVLQVVFDRARIFSTVSVSPRMAVDLRPAGDARA